MVINTEYTGEYDATVLAVAKLVRQFVESGRLKDRFSIFDKEEVTFGKGYEMSVVLAATDTASSGTKTATEHGKYSPNGFSLIFSDTIVGQFPITIEDARIKECVGDVTKQEEYAAELVQSMYQGWIKKKNKYVSDGANALIDGATNTVSVTLGTDTEKYAVDVITQIKAKVEDIREGVTGTSYGNSVVGEEEIAATDVAIVMSNALGALLDTNGYAKAFNEQYLALGDVQRVTSNKIAEGKVLVTDARNIQVRRKYEKMVGPLQNADGSYNMIYNKEEYIEVAKTTDGVVAFPYVVITTTAAAESAAYTPAAASEITPEEVPEETAEKE